MGPSTFRWCCAAFHYLGPALASAAYYIVCIDLPGHGRSDHRSKESYYSFMEYIATVAEVLQSLAWPQVHLVGHSLGGGITAAVAAALPGQVASLTLLESMGPLSKPADEMVKHLQRALTTKSSLARHDGSTYDSVDAAVAQRVATVTRYAGAQSLSMEAAQRLVLRALEEVPSPAAAADAGGGAKFRFRHDRRIMCPSLLYLTEEHVHALLKGVTCRVLAISGVTGWPVLHTVLAARLSCLAKVVHVTLPGSHHAHADPDTQQAVVNAVTSFLQTPDSAGASAAL